MKEGLIRLKNEKNIFYDSIEKVYRYRMHCPMCGKIITPCQCYHDLYRLERDIDDGIADYTCSSKCSLMGNEWEELGEAMQAVGIDNITNIADLTEKQACAVLEILTENADFDYPGGEDCII